jgi:hypothetical protein
MAEDEFGYFQPMTLEDLCRSLVSNIPIPGNSREKVDRFVERVISGHRNTHSVAIVKIEQQLSERTQTLKTLTDLFRKLEDTVKAIQSEKPHDVISLLEECKAKDQVIESLTAELSRRIDADKTCKVCAEDMSDDKTYANRCGHILCKDCWSRLQRTNSYCPLCRDVVVYTHRVYL